LVVDEGVYEPLQTGVMLSRANVLFYKHNDMEDLRRILEQVRRTDAKIGRKSSDQRRFIVAESLYKHYGHITPLDTLVQLKNEFSYRLILDESYSFGVLGANGRGIVELYEKNIMADVEIVTISLENTMASIGGICIGTFEVVDHQRLSGAGYCFSASNPPFLVASAISSLNSMQQKPHLRETLYRIMTLLRQSITTSIPQLTITSHDLSPLFYLRLTDAHPRVVETSILDRIVQRCLHYGVLIASAGHFNETHFKIIPPPSIRINATALLSEKDVQFVADSLRKAVLDILQSNN